MFLPLAIFNDVGGGEMVIVFLVALLLYGRDLPLATRKIGRTIASFKRTFQDASREIQREMDIAARDFDEIGKEAEKTKDDLKKSLQDPVTPPATVARTENKPEQLDAPQPPPHAPSNASAAVARIENKPAQLDVPQPPPHAQVSVLPEAPLPPATRPAPSSDAAALGELDRVPVPSKIPPPV